MAWFTFLETHTYNCRITRCKVNQYLGIINIIFIIFFLVCIFLLVISYIHQPSHINILLIDKNAPPPHKTDIRFLSITLDTAQIANKFAALNFSNPKLIKVTNALAPAFLRVGGTAADRLIFSTKPSLRTHHYQIDGGACAFGDSCDNTSIPYFSMTVKEWLELNEFVQNTQLEMIFDLNALLRFQNGSWNYKNAKKLISFSDSRGFNINWELGNEPDAFKHQFNRQINASQLAEDYHVLRNMLNRYPRYNSSIIIGPSTTRPRSDRKESEKYLDIFLANSHGAPNAISWHQYYFDGRNGQLRDFLDSSIFDILKYQISVVQNTVKSHSLNKSIWLGETSSAWGGGVLGVSDKFVASFIWLDKLGLSAKMGLDVVIRQTLVGGNYGLLDEDYEPNPDWWISILYKKLVNPQVVNCRLASTSKIRLYCHCAKNDGFYDKLSPVVVFGMNLGTIQAKVRIQGIPQFDNNLIEVYTITTNSSLISKYVFLNDVLLKLTADYEIPDLKPNLYYTVNYLTIPPHAIIFWMIPVTNVTYC